MFRRRQEVPEPLRAPYRAFAEVAAALEAAKRELLRAIPGARVPGVPLAEALLRYREGLDAAAAGMAAWRVPELDGQWTACSEGIVAARAGEERVRLGGAPFAHDQLLFTLQDLIAPLEPFDDASRRWAALRRSD